MVVKIWKVPIFDFFFSFIEVRMNYQVAILMVFFAAAAIIANLYILKIFIATKFSETQIDIKLPIMGQEGIENFILT